MSSKKIIFFFLTLLGMTEGLQAELPGYLADAFDKRRWVAYSPTGPSPSPESESVIEADLRTLQQAGFSGIVTYGCDGLKRKIPGIAHRAGISHVIVGVYDLKNQAEMDNAKALASQVDGYCVGNEGIQSSPERYTMKELISAVDELRKWTGRPVTTSEQIEKYHDPVIGPQLIALSDWLFPNVHPFWNGRIRQPEAGEWTRDQVSRLKTLSKNKLILCKEVGLPTASLQKETRASDEHEQSEYYASLRAFRVPFVYFEAFDQPWKTHHPVEPFWGLFDKDRRPKEVISQLAKPTPGIFITSPKSEGTVTVRIMPEGGFFYVRGTAIGLAADRELILFVNTGDDAAPGWILQFGENGIRDVDEGKWSARGQIGNQQYPPQPGSRISIRVLAVAKDVAQRLRTDRENNVRVRNTGIRSQDLPVVNPQWRADVNDVVVEINKTTK